MPILRFFLSADSTTEDVLKAVYNALWIWPVYALSFLLNSIWYQEIADFAQQLQQGASDKSRPKPKRLSLSQVLTDEIYRSLLFGGFLMQTTLVLYIPYIGPTLSFICVAWIYAFYSFEYNWINAGWSLDTRMLYFEQRWCYFLGFGIPCTALTFFFPQFVGAGVFAMLFPLYILISFVAKPVPAKLDREYSLRFLPDRVSIFYFAKRFNHLLIKILQKRTGIIRTSQRKPSK